MRIDGGRFTRFEGVKDIASDEIVDVPDVIRDRRERSVTRSGEPVRAPIFLRTLVIALVAHANSAPSLPRPSLSFCSPRRILVLIVPSGSPNASAISRWVMPRKYAISIASRCAGGRAANASLIVSRNA